MENNEEKTKNQNESLFEEVGIDEEEYQDEKSSEKMSKNQSENENKTLEQNIIHQEKDSFWNVFKEKAKTGWFVSIGFVFQTIGTAIRNFLFSQRDQITISDFLSEVSAKEKLDAKQKETTNKFDKQEKVQNNEKETTQNEPASRESINNKDIHTANSDELNYAINSIFRENAVRNIFQQAGIVAEPGKDPNMIYIFNKNGNVEKRMFCMSGYDFLNGNADSLAGGLYNYENSNKELSYQEEIKEKIRASTLALSVIAAARYTMIDPDQSLMLEENQLLSSVNIMGKEGPVSLEIVVHPENRGQVAVLLNEKIILETDIDSLSKENVVKTLNKVALSQYNNIINKEHVVDSNLSFRKIENGQFAVRIGQSSKEYSFDTEQDIKDLYKDLNKSNVHVNLNNKEISNKAIAYTIAHLCNKSLVPSIDQNNNYLNPFTGNPEPAGKSHISISYGDSGISFTKNLPVENKIIDTVYEGPLEKCLHKFSDNRELPIINDKVENGDFYSIGEYFVTKSQNSETFEVLKLDDKIEVDIDPETSLADLNKYINQSELEMKSSFVGNVKSLTSLSNDEIVDIAEKISDAIEECNKNDLIVENYVRDTPVIEQDFFEEPIEDNIAAGAEVLDKRIKNDQVFDESFEINLGDFFPEEIRNTFFPDNNETEVSDFEEEDFQETEDIDRYSPNSSDFQPDIEITL